jgi:protein disulfide-isomerase A6
LILVAICSQATAFYAKTSGVIILDSKNFKKEVINSDELWLVEFFAPWCGHCKALKPVWEKVAKALKGVVKVGAVDMDADPQAGAPYDVKGFPTIKFFGADKKSPEDYQGGRDENSIVQYVFKQIKKAVKDRLKGKQQSSSSSSNSKSKETKANSDGDVVVLTDSNFNDVVYKSKDIWLIEFYAPWCGHCKKLQPEWSEAATALKGQVKFGKVDATVEKRLASRFGIQGYPTIKYWEYGSGKSDSSAKPYEGGRSASDFQQFAANMLSSTDIEPEVYELINHQVFNEE